MTGVSITALRQLTERSLSSARSCRRPALTGRLAIERSRRVGGGRPDGRGTKNLNLKAGVLVWKKVPLSLPVAHVGREVAVRPPWHVGHFVSGHLVSGNLSGDGHQ